MFRLVRFFALLILFSGSLYAENKPLSFSAELVLERFFKDLFENTTAGYVLYGEKPVYVNGFKPLHKTLPGSDERFRSVIGLLAQNYWKLKPSKSKKYKLQFLQNSDNIEIILINRDALSRVFRENALLFEYKFGDEVSPDFLVQKLLKEGFSSLFKQHIALQGIALGYGAESSILFEKGKLLIQSIESKPTPPYKLDTQPKNPTEMLEKIKHNSWASSLQDFTCYKPSGKTERVKIPFNYIKHSKKSKKLINRYKEYQVTTEAILKKKNFLELVLQRLRLTLDSKKKTESQNLDEFFSTSEKKQLSKIIAKNILATFQNQISSIFFQGMKDAKKQNMVDESKTSFLDILWQRGEKALEPTNRFFAQISKQQGVECLIPRKLYILL